MPRLSASELQQPFFVRAAIASAEQGFGDVPSDLVSAAMDEWATISDEIPSDLETQLADIAEAFSLTRSVEPYLGRPGLQKQLLQRLRDGGDVYEVLAAMAPEFVIELSGYLRTPDADWVLDPVGYPAEVIARVRRAAGKFACDYEPFKGPSPDLALETAVRSLVELLQQQVGRIPIVTGNKHVDRVGPTAGCAGARAINILLRGIDRRLTTTKVMNMITKVKARPEPTEDPGMAMMRANPIRALDCSLLPGRDEAIEALLAEEHPL